MTTFDPTRNDGDDLRSEQPVVGYVLSALCLLGMAALTALNWGDMADYLTRSRRPMLIEPHKALGNAIAPVCLLIVAALLSLAPTWNQQVDRLTGRPSLGHATRRRTLDVALGLTALTLLVVHLGLVAAYLGHEVDPATLSAWCLSGVAAFLALAVLLRAWPPGRPAPGVLPTGAALGLTTVLGFVLSVDRPLAAVAVTAVAVALAIVAVVLLQVRGANSRSQAAS